MPQTIHGLYVVVLGGKSYRGKIFVPTAQNAGMNSKLRANGGPAITKALLNGAGVNKHELRCPGLNQGWRQSGRDLSTYIYTLMAAEEPSLSRQTPGTRGTWTRCCRQIPGSLVSWP